jgi:hypothetical protein
MGSYGRVMMSVQVVKYLFILDSLADSLLSPSPPTKKPQLSPGPKM